MKRDELERVMAEQRHPRRSPRKPMRGRWQCRTCGQVIDGTWASAERHADEHGGARLESVITDDGTAAH